MMENYIFVEYYETIKLIAHFQAGVVISEHPIVVTNLPLTWPYDAEKPMFLQMNGYEEHFFGEYVDLKITIT